MRMEETDQRREFRFLRGIKVLLQVADHGIHRSAVAVQKAVGIANALHCALNHLHRCSTVHSEVIAACCDRPAN